MEDVVDPSQNHSPENRITNSINNLRTFFQALIPMVKQQTL